MYNSNESQKFKVMFQGQFCQQTFHKKLLFMNTYNVYTVRGFIK